ncbi:MAG TPA: hypothetical protein VIU38_14570 [Anaerolineales bacterium]
MSKIRLTRWLTDIQLPSWTPLALVLTVCLYAFGILLARLGYFQDDWHHIFEAYWYGSSGLRSFLLGDRGPFAYLIYVPFFKLLGFVPAHWHWSLLVLRFCTAAFFWLGFRQIWPGKEVLTGWLVLIFAIYPAFHLQPLAVAYTLHWSMYLAFAASVFLMLLAARHPRAYMPLTASAMLLEVLHLLVIEYFSGLVLSRMVLLWLSFAGLPARQRWKNSLRHSLPYLAIFLLYLVYRSSFVSLIGVDRFPLEATLLGSGGVTLRAAAQILETVLQDVVYVLISSWYSAIDPATIELSRVSTLGIYASMLVLAGLAFLLFSRLQSQVKDSNTSSTGKGIAAGGFLCVIFGMLPVWGAGLSIFQKNLLWSDRLALPAMLGASMVVVGLVSLLVDRASYRNLILSALLALGIGQAGFTARSYQSSWDKQEHLYWQLHWRAPALRSGTLVVADQEVLYFMGVGPASFALNMLYPQRAQWPKASYWFNAGMEGIDWERFSAGVPAEFGKHTATFTATRDGVLAITFLPERDQCLWVLRPEYESLRDLSDMAKTWLGVSNLARIESAPLSVPPPEIFGAEPAHDWCYYFEKADLARQLEQWSKILGLWAEAQAGNLRAGSGIELLPFVEAQARTGDWRSAGSLTMQAVTLPGRATPVFCDLWRDLVATTPATPDRDEVNATTRDRLQCQ